MARRMLVLVSAISLMGASCATIPTKVNVGMVTEGQCKATGPQCRWEPLWAYAQKDADVPADRRYGSCRCDALPSETGELVIVGAMTMAEAEFNETLTREGYCAPGKGTYRNGIEVYFKGGSSCPPAHLGRLDCQLSAERWASEGGGEAHYPFPAQACRRTKVDADHGRWFFTCRDLAKDEKAPPPFCPTPPPPPHSLTPHDCE